MKPERRDGQASDPEKHLPAGGDESDGDGAIAVMAAAPFDTSTRCTSLRGRLDATHDNVVSDRTKW
jgi:hypothetical protein